MGSQRQGLIRGLKIWFDITLLLGGAGIVILIFILFFTAIAGDSDGGMDVAFPIAMGTGALRPVIPLTPGPGTDEGISNLRVVDGRGELRFTATDSSPHLMTMGAFVLAAAVALWVIFLFRRILSNTAGGNPFHRENVRALNQIGWILVAAGIGTPWVENVIARRVLSQIHVADLALTPPLDFSPEAIVGGLLLLVLASVWKEAAQMAEEQSLTV